MRDAGFDRKEKESAGISMQVVGDTMLPLGVLGSCAAAIAMGMSMPPLLPILFGVLGCYLSWALSRVLRGLGEMVEDAAATRAASVTVAILAASAAAHKKRLHVALGKIQFQFTAALEKDVPVSILQFGSVRTAVAVRRNLCRHRASPLNPS